MAARAVDKVPMTMATAAADLRRPAWVAVLRQRLRLLHKLTNLKTIFLSDKIGIDHIQRDFISLKDTL
jgi:hypothetical protein